MDLFNTVRELVAAGQAEKAWEVACAAPDGKTAEERIAALVTRAEAAQGTRREAEGAEICANLAKLLEAFRPQNFELLIGAAVRLRRFRFYAEAAAALNAAIEVNLAQGGDGAQLARALNNLGLVAEDLRQWDTAERFFRTAISADDQDDFHVNLGHVLLRKGHLEEGWSEYAHRAWPPQTDQVCRRWTHDIPAATALAGDLVVLQEQGAGDCIQFMRYLPVLREHCQGRITFFGSNAIAQLGTALGVMEGIEATSNLTVSGTPPLGVRLIDLPRLLDLPILPGDRVDDSARAPGPLRIGLCWKGNPLQSNDHNRSLGDGDAQALIAGMPDAEWYRLQLDGALDGLLAPENPPADWIETARLILAMDVVVSVCTSNAHLAATLGKPALILLTYSPDWRWGTDEEDSTWYPTAHLLRQVVPNDWKQPILHTLDALRDMSMRVGS